MLQPDKQPRNSQQRYEQAHDVTLTQSAETSPFTAMAKDRIIRNCGMNEQQWAVYNAEVSISLLTLRTAFPTQARNYSDKEHDMLTALWLEIFVEVVPGVLLEAAMQFIATDRKGFFPSPGQIMGIVEDILAKRETAEKEKRTREHAEELRKYYGRVESGENCSTCRFCERREFVHPWDKGQNDVRLYCQNPNSYKYEGEHGHGTAACIVCEYYEPYPQA